MTLKGINESSDENIGGKIPKGVSRASYKNDEMNRK
jgi:hypothetical protein